MDERNVEDKWWKILTLGSSLLEKMYEIIYDYERTAKNLLDEILK